MRLQVALAALALAACGDDASHLSLPHVVSHGGPVLSTVNLVTIAYADDPLADLAARFDDAVVHTRWMRAVGDEYGVQGGAHLAAYRSPLPAPAHLTYTQVQQLAPDLIAAGAVPGPTHDGVPVLYVIYLPPTTSVTNDDGTGAMCATALAYHDYRGNVPFALIPTCYPGSELARTTFASHEIAEAATDPFLTGYYVDPADHTDPYHYAQPEVADLCNRVLAPSEDGFALEASWSNAEADAWQVHPCQPIADGDVYTMVEVDPAAVIDASRGDTVRWTLTGYASGPTDAWPLEARHGYAGDSGTVNDEMAATVQFSPRAIGAGLRSTATATVPLDAPSGTVVAVNVWSRTTWNLLAVRVR